MIDNEMIVFAKKTILSLVLMFFSQICSSQEKVQYFEDNIYTFTNETVSFLSSSTWEVVGTNYFPLGSALIILDLYEKQNKTYDVIFINGTSYLAFHKSGRYFKNTGYIGEVKTSSSDGSTLVLESGEIIKPLETSDTAYWTPPYQILIAENQSFFYNLDESKKVNIYSID